jgi:hypothetical protein
MAFRNRINTRHPRQKYRNRRGEVRVIIEDYTNAINRLNHTGRQSANTIADGTVTDAAYLRIKNLSSDAQSQFAAIAAQIAANAGPAIASGTLANRPAPGTVGRYFLATDFNQLFYDNGAEWKSIGGHRQTFAKMRQSAVAQNIAQAFTTIILPTVDDDPGANFTTATSTYTVPTDGIYLCNARVRYHDLVPQGISYGLGINTSNLDGTFFQWYLTNPLYRQGASYLRIANLTTGDQLRLYSYFDYSSGGTIFNAEMNVFLLAQN